MSMHEKIVEYRDQILSAGGNTLSRDEAFAWAANDIVASYLGTALKNKDYDRARFLSDSMKVLHRDTQLDSAINKVMSNTNRHLREI